MDRYEQENSRSSLLCSAHRRCGQCSRHRFHDESRQLESTGRHFSRENIYRNHEVRSRRVQWIARQPESVSGDSSVSHCHRPNSSWRRRAVPGRTLLVHGLGNEINCDMVFNMFCLYGNVTAVKILSHRQVLVELNNVEAAERCVSNLHLLPLNQKNKLKVKYSKHAYINDQKTLIKLSDGTPTQKNYIISKFNRFSSKNKIINERRIAAPSKILHFFNVPVDISGSKIRTAVINALGCNDAIRSITILPQKQPRAKFSTGLLEMKSVDLAAKAIMLLNHMKLESSRSEFPFWFKLCFSKWSDMRQKSADSSVLIFKATPRRAWLFHRSEHDMPTVEFKVSRINRVTNDDYPWTLWDMREHATEAINPEARISVDIEYDGPSGQGDTLQDPPLY
ncbi:heterogeneous nuclear ribonucleoprotein L-like isoform X2 [Sipha flava]|uniref:Heterogeneous nuclear ribonucleoprotein L-like isoform X2 n=1 Tax=Sipha flava TaxID=143950 RepID=A0A8B8FM30_9HEMI|nr:heterogeneous nuclear ribonucleoprotein L-like isoform X2 [Sipha flava]